MQTTEKFNIAAKYFEVNSRALTINPGYTEEPLGDGSFGGSSDLSTPGDITAKNPCYFNESVSIRKNIPANTAGAGVNGAILTVPASDWYNRYNGGTCTLWSAVNFGSIRIVTEKQTTGETTQGTVVYGVATTLFIDEPTEGTSATDITKLYAIYVNGKSLFTSLSTFENKINMPSNFIDIAVFGGNNPTQATNIKIQNGEEQSLVLGIAGADGNYSTSAVQGDAVISGDEDHNLFIQTGIGM